MYQNQREYLQIGKLPEGENIILYLENEKKQKFNVLTDSPLVSQYLTLEGVKFVKELEECDVIFMDASL